MSKGSKSQTQTTTNSPWAPTQSYLKGILADAEELYNENPRPEFFPGSTFSTNPATIDAIQGMIDRASNPAGTPVGNIDNVLMRTMSPDLAGMGDAVRAEVMPAVNSRFQMAGRSGSGLHTEAMSKGITRGMAPFALQANAQSMDAARAAPALANADLNNLYQSGILAEGVDQRQISEDMARHAHEQNAPWEALGRYASFPQGQASLGGTSTVTGPAQQGRSPWQSALGLGLGAAGLFTGNPFLMGGGGMPGIVGGY